MYTELGTIIYTGVVLFVAYMVRGISGFGSALIAIPLLTIVHPLPLVVPLVVALDYFGSTSQGLSNRSSIQWRDLAALVPFTLAGILTAIFLFQSLDARYLTNAMALFIIVFALYQLLPLPAMQGSRLWAGPAGFLGGLLGTVFGTGGPFYMIYLSIRGLSKPQTRASFATYFFIDGSIRIMGYIYIGMLGISEFIMYLKWLPAAAVGLYIGGKIHTEIPAKTFKYFISLILVLSGFKLLTR